MRIALCNEVLGAMPLADQCELAAALGYDGLEIAPFTLADSPHRIDSAEAKRIRGVVESTGLVVTGLHWLLVRPAGLSLTDPDAAVRARTLEVVTRLIGHVQVNDPNRRAPGQGAMKFAPIFAALKRNGYDATVAVEPFDYVPDGPGAAAFAAGYLRGIRECLA